MAPGVRTMPSACGVSGGAAGDGGTAAAVGGPSGADVDPGAGVPRVTGGGGGGFVVAVAVGVGVGVAPHVCTACARAVAAVNHANANVRARIRRRTQGGMVLKAGEEDARHLARVGDGARRRVDRGAGALGASSRPLRHRDRARRRHAGGQEVEATVACGGPASPRAR